MPEPQREQFGSPEEEIKALEEKLQQKKQELLSRGAPVPEEKEVFREVLKQHIEEAHPVSPPQVTPISGLGHLPADDFKKKTDNTKEKEIRQEQVRDLVELALSSSIRDAIKEAEKSTPYLLDELHDHLVDEYYDKLLALRKIKAI